MDRTAALTAIKLRTSDLVACEAFFVGVFGFAVTHRYGGGAEEPFAEIVLTLAGADAPMLKFIHHRDAPPADATGATIQIVLDDIDGAIRAATAMGATLLMPPTDYPAAGVRMAVIGTALGLEIELVRHA